ncbi:hypothetical protein GXM_00571 [Nostoc sphaeroides CCNUC1]|uniref:Uncharacterized protein n=1 Tax=Nostoc sphaeroides CCNUC1 TaxID=2653204 RepID=A0A5P8VRL9_9NOSO|nr:hypothetical protein GXM_00571 [Nostoc sphaeroides CCNUC1]
MLLKPVYTPVLTLLSAGENDIYTYFWQRYYCKTINLRLESIF